MEAQMNIHRLLVDQPDDVALAAEALVSGAVVAAAFANFYVIVTRPDAATVRYVNLSKGRPLDQVGSITTSADRIAGVFECGALPPGVSADAVRAFMDRMYGFGPFGFRGPARRDVPDHLTQPDRGVRTTQVIAPGQRCPSNAFFTQAVEALGTDILYITSANRSRHLTGAAEEPAHWQAPDLAADFAHVPELVVLAHRDEAAARAEYPAFAPTSVTLLSFHATVGGGDRPTLAIDRHGSLPIEAVRPIAAEFGFDVVLAPSARQRLRVRTYAGTEAVPA
jgi:hypothetical protein